MTEKTHESKCLVLFGQITARTAFTMTGVLSKKDGITVKEGDQIYIYTIYHDCERSKE